MMNVIDAFGEFFWDPGAYTNDVDVRADRGKNDLKNDQEDVGDSVSDVKEATNNPADGLSQIRRTSLEDLDTTQYELPKGKKAFFDRHPVMRLLLGGAILSIASAVFLGGGVLAGGAIAFLPGLLGLTGFAAVVTGIAIGLAVVSATWTVSKSIGSPGLSLAATAVDDLVQWRKMKKNLKDFKTSPADIELAHKHFYTPSPVPVEILIRNDTILTNQQKYELFKMSREEGADRSTLFDSYQIARQVREGELKQDRVNSPMKPNEESRDEITPFPDRFILYVSGSKETQV